MQYFGAAVHDSACNGELENYLQPWANNFEEAHMSMAPAIALSSSRFQKMELKEEPPNHSGTIYIFFLLFTKVRPQMYVMTIRIDLPLLCFKSHRCTWRNESNKMGSVSVYSWLPSHHSRKVFIGAILMPRGLSGLITPAEWDIIDFNESVAFCLKW